MEKNEIVDAVYMFFEIFSGYAKKMVNGFISKQPKYIDPDIPILNSEEIVKKWYKYLIVHQSKNNPNQINSKIKSRYNFDSFLLSRLIYQVLKDKNFKIYKEQLIEFGWLRKKYEVNSPYKFQFSYLVSMLILDYFSFEFDNITLNFLKKWNFELNTRQREDIIQIIENLDEDYLELTIFYFIFGIKLENLSKDFDSELGMTIEEITPKKLTNLTKFLKIGVPYEDSSRDLHSCDAINYLISRKVRMLKEDFKNKENNTLKKEQIYFSSYLEEGFHLLGFKGVSVKAYSQPNPYDINNFYLEFYPERIVSHISSRNKIKNWNFTDLHTFKGAIQTLELNERTSLFIREFPKILFSQSQMSLISNIFHRFRRINTATFILDIIVDSMIILDAIFTEGSEQLSYQIRMKTPWLISKNVEERIHWKEIIKLLYTIRSKIVHETGTKIKKQVNKFGGYPNAALYASEMVRGILLQIISIEKSKIEFQNIKNLRKKLENAGLGKVEELIFNEFYNTYSKEKLSDLGKKFILS